MLKKKEEGKPIIGDNVLCKTHPKSYMKSFHITSDFADSIFSEKQKSYRGSECVVLQVTHMRKGWLLAEIVSKEDYEANPIVFTPNGEMSK